MHTKLTVVIATFNSSLTIERALVSVLRQTFCNFEVLVIDGNSTDRTVEIVLALEDDRIKCISEPDSGIYDAFNKGIKLSTGELICFLGADDTFCDTRHFQMAIDSFNDLKGEKNNMPLVGIFSGITFVKEGKTVREWPVSENEYRYYKACVPPHPGAFYSRASFENLGLFDDSYRISGDYEWMLRFKEAGGNTIFMTTMTSVEMEVGGVSTSKKAFLKKMKEDLIICRRYFGSLGIFYYFQKLALKFKQVSIIG